MRTRPSLAVALAMTLLFAGAVGAMGTVTAQDDATECEYPITVTDATGTEMTIEEPPKRVVTLSPSSAQTMWEIGAQGTVTAISDRGTYLDGTDDLPTINSDDGPISTELVVDQEPDLVLAPDIISDDKVQQLREANVAVYNFGPATTMEDVVEKTRLTGQLVGECEGAYQRADEMEQSVEIVRTAVEGQERPTVLYLLGGGFTAGEQTFINDIIGTAGGTNIAAEAGIEGYAQISAEVVADQNPEYIVVSNEAPGVVPATEAYNNTAAVQNDNIIQVNANYLNQPAPRTIQVVEDFASTWHPDAYESAAESFADEETTAVTTETEAPGVGPLVALIAVLGTIGMRRRD